MTESLYGNNRFRYDLIHESRTVAS